METDAMIGKASHPVSECTFDFIDSPQYLNFDGSIPEAKDSYFECKNADSKAEQPNAESLQKLPTDFGDDLIRSVEKLKVSQPSSNPTEIITSTPFRVEGVQPMPWRSNTKVQSETRHCTKTRPFSFEERNKQILQRKARRIETILQAEKEARKFRANPVPKFLKKTSTSHNPSTTAGENLEKEKKNKTTTDSQLGPAPPRFRAKSPKVLRRAPFQPNLPRQPLLPPKPFVLSSELRAKDRELFDNYLKEKERLDERLRKMREAAQKRRDEEEIIKMRKEMVIKAQPIRKFKCISTPVLKRPLTEPMTPIMIKRQRR